MFYHDKPFSPIVPAVRNTRACSIFQRKIERFKMFHDFSWSSWKMFYSILNARHSWTFSAQIFWFSSHLATEHRPAGPWFQPFFRSSVCRARFVLFKWRFLTVLKVSCSVPPARRAFSTTISGLFRPISFLILLEVCFLIYQKLYFSWDSVFFCVDPRFFPLAEHGLTMVYILPGNGVVNGVDPLPAAETNGVTNKDRRKKKVRFSPLFAFSSFFTERCSRLTVVISYQSSVDSIIKMKHEQRYDGLTQAALNNWWMYDWEPFKTSVRLTTFPM